MKQPPTPQQAMFCAALASQLNESEYAAAEYGDICLDGTWPMSEFCAAVASAMGTVVLHDALSKKTTTELN